MKNRYDLDYVKRIEKELFRRECNAAIKCDPNFTIEMKQTGDLLTIFKGVNGYYMKNSYNPLVYIVEGVSLKVIAMLIADNDVR